MSAVSKSVMPGLERGVDHGERLLVVAARAEVVRAEADDRDLRPAFSECSRAHEADAIRARRASGRAVDDDERLRRPRQRDVELAEPGVAALLDDQRRLDDDDVVELEALRLAAASARAPTSRRTSRRLRRVGERARPDHGEQPVELGRLAQRGREQLVLGDPHELRRRAALAVRERPLGVGRDQVEQRQREVHDLAGHAVGVAQLLDRHVDAGGRNGSSSCQRP